MQIIQANYNSFIPIKKNNNNVRIAVPTFKGNNKNNEISYPISYYTNLSGKIDVKQEELKRPPFKDCTVKKLDNVYENYHKNLQEISKPEIQNAISELSNDKNNNFAEKDITSAMQKLTQFGNMKSLNKISDALDKNNVGMIANSGTMYEFYTQGKPYSEAASNNFGLNTTLHYLLEGKCLHNLDGSNIAIFLDNNKLEQLEELNKSKPESIEELRKKKNIKFFIVSGWDKGINFLNRTKDIKKETKKILLESKSKNISIEDAVDKDTIDRANSLGLNAIVIKNENNPSAESIYNQLRPEQFSRKELNAVLDATVINRIPNSLNNRVEAKDALADYLNNKLEVYTPERMAKESKKIYKALEKFAKSKGKTMDDVVYIIPKTEKSYDLINHQYQLVNNIPKNKIISNSSPNCNIDNHSNDNKIIAILDDCSLSGSSLLSEISDEGVIDYRKMANISKDRNINLAIVTVYGSNTAEKELNKALRSYQRANDDIFIKLNSNEKQMNDSEQTINSKYLLNKSLGEQGWKEENHCLIFPYMCPDNNSEFAANIGVFHNINYRADNDTDSGIKNISQTNIKTLYNTPKEIAKLTDKLLVDEDDKD